MVTEELRVEPVCSWAGIGLLSLGTVDDELGKPLGYFFSIFETGSHLVGFELRSTCLSLFGAGINWPAMFEGAVLCTVGC